MQKEKSQKRVLVISGPTGVGENTLVSEIRKKFPVFKQLTTATTRKPRFGEEDKVTYYFMDNERFFKEIKNGNIPEYQNSRDKDIYYGTYLPDLEKKLAQGDNIIVTPDITGTRFFKEKYNATTIFIMPDSMENLKKRHIKRTPDISEEELNERLKYAQYEIDNEASFYDFKVVNEQDKLEEAVVEILEIAKRDGYEFEK